jgi:hypothetical protein
LFLSHLNRPLTPFRVAVQLGDELPFIRARISSAAALRVCAVAFDSQSDANGGKGPTSSPSDSRAGRWHPYEHAQSLAFRRAPMFRPTDRSTANEGCQSSAGFGFITTEHPGAVDMLRAVSNAWSGFNDVYRSAVGASFGRRRLLGSTSAVQPQQPPQPRTATLGALCRDKANYYKQRTIRSVYSWTRSVRDGESGWPAVYRQGIAATGPAGRQSDNVSLSLSAMDPLNGNNSMRYIARELHQAKIFPHTCPTFMHIDCTAEIMQRQLINGRHDLLLTNK